MSRVVRPMRPEDLTRAAAVEATASEAWSWENLAEELAGDSGRLFVLEENGTVCGLAVFQLVLEEASLLTFTVEPAQRGRGLGETLLKESLNALCQEGAGQCFLEVRSGNAPARGLYDKLGFTAVGLRKGFYHEPAEDAVVMTLSL